MWRECRLNTKTYNTSIELNPNPELFLGTWIESNNVTTQHILMFVWLLEVLIKVERWLIDFAFLSDMMISFQLNQAETQLNPRLCCNSLTGVISSAAGAIRDTSAYRYSNNTREDVLWCNTCCPMLHWLLRQTAKWSCSRRFRQLLSPFSFLFFPLVRRASGSRGWDLHS